MHQQQPTYDTSNGFSRERSRSEPRLVARITVGARWSLSQVTEEACDGARKKEIARSIARTDGHLRSHFGRNDNNNIGQ